MRSVHPHSEAVVIGGGVTGAFAAFFLARRGVPTTLVERDGPDGIGRHASGHNPGGLNPLHGPGIPGPMQPLAWASFELHLGLWDEIRDLSGLDFSPRRASRVLLAVDESDLAALARARALDEAAPGFAAELLDGEQLRSLEPRLAPGFVAGLRTVGNGSVDAFRYTRAVAAAAQKLGASVVRGTASALERSGARVTGVIVDGERVPCDFAVVATGPWAAQPARWLGVALPVRPVKGELLEVGIGIRGQPFAHDFTWREGAIYGGAGATAWLGGTEEEAGFDASPSRGGRAAILARAGRIVPEIARLPLLRHVAALRPVTPDQLPIVGLAPGWDNVFLALGGGRKGMLLSAALGRAAADTAAEGATSLPLGPCRPERFQPRAVQPDAAAPAPGSRSPDAARVRRFRTRCTGCARSFEGRFAPLCDRCGGLTEVAYDLERARLYDSENPFERFRDLIPVDDAALLPAHARFTPTVHATRLGEVLGMPWLYLKDETVLPSGTTKDRMASVALAYLHECGVRSFCASSTGNSSTAFAQAISRFPDLALVLFTASAFRGRLQYDPSDQIVEFVLRGATFVEATRVANAYAARRGLTAERGFFNPGRREGLKLALLESVEQVPGAIDWYVQAVSSAMGVHGAFKGALELCRLGRIARPPRLLCVQQETCAPMAAAWEEGSETIEPHHVVHKPAGIAEAILRGDPSGAYPHVRRVVQASDGRFAAVSESEIREAREAVESLEGIRPCFSAAAALAGLIRLVRRGELPREAVVLVNLTGRERARGPERPLTELVHTGSGWELADPGDARARALWPGPLEAGA